MLGFIYLFILFFLELILKGGRGGGGDIGICGVAVSLNISGGVAVNKLLSCGVAVISNLTVCVFLILNLRTRRNQTTCGPFASVDVYYLTVVTKTRNNKNSET